MSVAPLRCARIGGPGETSYVPSVPQWPTLFSSPAMLRRSGSLRSACAMRPASLVSRGWSTRDVRSTGSRCSFSRFYRRRLIRWKFVDSCATEVGRLGLERNCAPLHRSHPLSVDHHAGRGDAGGPFLAPPVEWVAGSPPRFPSVSIGRSRSSQRSEASRLRVSYVRRQVRRRSDWGNGPVRYSAVLARRLQHGRQRLS